MAHEVCKFSLFQAGKIIGGIDVGLSIASKSEVVLETNYKDGNNYRGYDFIDCLDLLRLDLEKEELLIGCNGCLENYTSSGMSRDMSRGKVGYLVNLGAKPGKEDRCRVFDPVIDTGRLATLDQQIKFKQSWLESIRPKNS